MYTKDAFLKDCVAVFRETEGNRVDIPGIGEVVLYDEPLIGFASADDRLFEEYRRPEVIGENFYTPTQWLPSAGTVAAFFLPFTEAVRVSNRADKREPSLDWLYARIEGQTFINRFMDGLRRRLEGKGVDACVPGRDNRFGTLREPTEENGLADFHVNSRWSERHAAYACGLGTFGLSRGLITAKGMAGRFASVIVSEKWEASERPYTGVYDYCIRCGACARNCPAGAISLETGKNNTLCDVYATKLKEKFAPRYGCGKCQVGVPCECMAPGMGRGTDRSRPSEA